MEEVTKCCYIDCTDPQEKDHTLHELPVCNTALCVKWLVNTGHVDLISRDFETLRSMKFFICNNHFSEECYLSKGTLRDSAVPFPHWHNGTRKAATGQGQVEVNSHSQGPKNGSGLTLNKHGAFFTIDETLQNESVDASSTGVKGNPDLWCRTCAMRKETDNLISMTTRMKDTDMSLLSKLKLLIEIDEEDALPTKMCDQCVLKLEQSFKFFQQIYIADNTLRHLLSTVEQVPGRQSTLPESKTNDFAEPLLDKGNKYDIGISPGRDLPGFEVVESVRQTRQSRAIVPRTRRLVGRPRGSGTRLSRSSRLARASRSARLSRGTRSWRSRGSHNATINGELLAPVTEPAHHNQDDEAIDQESTRENKENKQGQQQELLEGCTTVFTLLTDACCSDEELDWLDVLKLMSRQSRPCANEEAETRLRCEICHASFPLREQLRVHLLSQHWQQHNEHMCADCRLTFHNETELTNHRISCHYRQRYHCDYCQQGFLEKSQLSEHILDCRDGDESLVNTVGTSSAKKRCTDNRDCSAGLTATPAATATATASTSSQCPTEENLDREIEIALKPTNTANNLGK